jgi:hypothetical protein
MSHICLYFKYLSVKLCTNFDCCWPKTTTLIYFVYQDENSSLPTLARMRCLEDSSLPTLERMRCLEDSSLPTLARMRWLEVQNQIELMERQMSWYRRRCKELVRLLFTELYKADLLTEQLYNSLKLYAGKLIKSSLVHLTKFNACLKENVLICICPF